jgi:hypothetical protein
MAGGLVVTDSPRATAAWGFVALTMGWTWCLGFAAAGLGGGSLGRALHALALPGPRTCLRS